MSHLEDKLNDTPIKNMGICGIFALHYITELPLAKIYNDYKNNFCRGLKRWNGSTRHVYRLRLLDILGLNYKEIKLEKEFTLKTVMKMFQNHKTPIMIRVRGHVMVLDNNLIYDQSNIGGIDINKCKHKNRRVTSATTLKE